MLQFYKHQLLLGLPRYHESKQNTQRFFSAHYDYNMEDKLNNFAEGTKRQDVIEELIDHDDIRAIVLKQFNYMRINGINLVQDADDLVNLYLKITKKFPK